MSEIRRSRLGWSARAVLFAGAMLCSAASRTAAGQEIDIQGNGVSIADGDTTPTTADWTDFGNTVVGIPYSETYTILNTGAAPLTLGNDAVSLIGAGCSNFFVTVQPNPSVPVSGSTAFTVRYLATSVGTAVCTVNVANDDSNENPYDFLIQATGFTGQEIDIQGNGVSIADGDTTPSTADWTDFGSTFPATPLSETYTIRNTGVMPLTLGNNAVSLIGAGCSHFFVTIPPNPSVPVSGSTVFTVRYTATGNGTDVCTVSVANDDSDENPYDFVIQGTGVIPTPEIDIQGNGVSIADGDTTPSTADWTDFGSTTAAIPLSETYTIRNTGVAPLTLGNNAVSLIGAGCSHFFVTIPPNPSVPVSGSTVFTVRYTASGGGTDVCTVSVANDDSDESPYDFVIQGTGAGPEIDVQGNGVSISDGDITPSTTDGTDFGSVAVGLPPVSRTFTIRNTGVAPLTLGSNAVSLVGAGCSDFSVTLQPAPSVAVSGSTAFTVRYTATGAGTDVCTVNVANDDSDESPYDFAIQGSGTTPSDIPALPGSGVIILIGLVALSGVRLLRS